MKNSTTITNEQFNCLNDMILALHMRFQNDREKAQMGRKAIEAGDKVMSELNKQLNSDPDYVGLVGVPTAQLPQELQHAQEFSVIARGNQQYEEQRFLDIEQIQQYLDGVKAANTNNDHDLGQEIVETTALLSWMKQRGVCILLLS